MEKNEESYILSLEFPHKSIRKIRFSGKSTLAEVHTAIIKEFRFIDTAHLHAFYMDNNVWNPKCEIIGIEGTCMNVKDRHNDTKVTLSDLNLKQGDSFIYIFDFTEGWRVRCVVEEILNEPTDTAVILFSEGEPPEQYPDYNKDFFRVIIENPNYPELTFRLWRQHINILETYLDIDVVNVDYSLTRWSFIPQVPIQTRGVMTHRYSNFVLRYLIRKYRMTLSALNINFLLERMKTDAFKENREKKFPGMSDEEIIARFNKDKEELFSSYDFLIEKLNGELKP